MKHGYDQCTRDCFAAYMGFAKVSLGIRSAFVDMPPPNYYTRFWRNQVTCSGFAMTNGNLEGVFSASKGQLANIVDCANGIAKRDGILIITLDCFEPLVPVWERHGFKAEHYMDWDDTQAPAWWLYDVHGTPRVAYMSKLVQ